MIDQLGSETNSGTPTAAYAAGRGPTLYELLDIPTYATRLQIRESYIRLKNTYATGSVALYSLVSEEEARATLEKVEEAYRILDDELSRKDYDEKAGIKREMRAPAVDNAPELHQTKVRRSLKDDDDDDSPWRSTSQAEAPKPMSRINQTFSKIKKYASRAFDDDVLAKVGIVNDQAKSFDGQVLVQLRESMGIQQSEVQERTKIAIEYIKALENNDFQKLPPLVYVRGFLKIYLQYLGIQDGSAALVEAYTEKYNHWRETNKTHSS